MPEASVYQSAEAARPVTRTWASLSGGRGMWTEDCGKRRLATCSSEEHRITRISSPMCPERRA
eukprot:3394443-Amphidinium_carterae.1